MRAFPQVFLSCLVFVVAGCSDGGGGSAGTLEVSVTDTPFPLTEDCLVAARVVVDGVEVQGDGGFRTIPLVDPVDGEVTFNLLELQAGISEKLAVGRLPTGFYHQIRLHVVEANLVFADGREVPFKIPSGMESGLKLNPKPHILIAANQTTPLMLDFDMTRSFHVAVTGGEPTCDDLRNGESTVIFRPVIHAMNPAENGVIRGTVTKEGEPIAGVEVGAFAAGTALQESTGPAGATFSAPSGLEDVEEGEYALLLQPGSYDLYLREQDVDEWTLATSGVAVEAQEIRVRDLSVP